VRFQQEGFTLQPKRAAGGDNAQAWRCAGLSLRMHLPLPSSQCTEIFFRLAKEISRFRFTIAPSNVS
jgi:hypothetical protein